MKVKERKPAMANLMI